MDNDVFLQHLRELPLEEGKAYIQGHVEELADYAAIGNLLADEALHLLYTPFVSLKLAELLIFFGEYIQHPSSHALGLKARGDALLQIGHYEAALDCLDTAGEEFLFLGDAGNWARSRISWVSSAVWLGRVEDALKAGEQARSVFLQLGEYYWAGVVDNNTALVYEFIGRYRDAFKLYENMLTIFSTVTDQSEVSIKRSIAIAKINQAEILSWLGQFEEAYCLFQEVKGSFILLGETSLAIYSETHLAELDYIQGYYGSALRRYYQARDAMVQDNVDSPLWLAELQLCIANCLVKLNRTQEACLLSGEAVKTCRQSSISLSTGNALREHARTLVASNRLKEALGALDEAWALFNDGGFEPYALVTRLQQAEILLQKGSFATAYAQAHVVKNYCDAQGLVAHSIHSSLLMAGALIAKAQQTELLQEKGQQTTLLQEAALLCKRVILQARQYNLQGEIYKSHYLLGRIFSLQHNFSKAVKHYGAAIAQIERILDDLVYDLSPSFLHTTWSVYEDMIALRLQQSQPEHAFYYLEQARSMALRQHLSRPEAALKKKEREGNDVSTTVLRTRYELRDWQEQHRKYSILLADIDTSLSPALNRDIIQAGLKHCEEKLNELFERLNLYEVSNPARSPGFRSRKAGRSEQAALKVQRVDITQVRQHLSGDHLLLSYYIHEGKLVIFAITAGDLMVHEHPDGSAQLEYLLPLLHAHLQPQGWPNVLHPPQQVIRRLLKKLYDLLISPALPLLPSSSGHLTIVPYGPLHQLPFHALYDGSRFLIEDYQVNYLPASSLLLHLAMRNSKQNDDSTSAEISVGTPLVLGYSDNGHLQRVHDEARTIASLLNGDCYLEKEATIARLIQQAPSSPIIHLATHGQSRLDAPNFSYVRLADGQLNAIDAFRLDLQKCELVTLSGCETGLSLSGGGDEQLGLSRSFLAAGATSLVISLWPVEDNATNELMQRFYQHLLQGESKVQALRTAQCSLLHQTESMYAHPYFWAAFRLVGDVGPLRYRNNQRL
jgi:CHAT domain-containing protein/tetratricopeptide (TPR) repeat protein